MREWIGCWFIRIGMAIIPADVRRMVQNILLFHVPGALTEEEMAEVIERQNYYKLTRKAAE